ncbi:MAG: hypothetical protein ACYDGR_12565 [Candidatus Dormibacteria bacterium]
MLTSALSQGRASAADFPWGKATYADAVRLREWLTRGYAPATCGLLAFASSAAPGCCGSTRWRGCDGVCEAQDLASRRHPDGRELPRIDADGLQIHLEDTAM